MSWFKRKKDKNTKNNNSLEQKNQTTNFNQPKTNQIIVENQEIKVNKDFVIEQLDQKGVKPSYFDYEKIQLNPFLTYDEQYRNQLIRDDACCPNCANKSKKCICFSKRYKKDMDAINRINSNIDATMMLEANNNLNNARKAYMNDLYLKQQPDLLKEYETKKEYNSKNNMDFYGLTKDDHKNIAQNIVDQAYKISEETNRMLKNQKTKVLDLLTDENINIPIRKLNDPCDKYNPYADVDNRDLQNYNQLTKEYEKLNQIDESLLQKRYNLSEYDACNILRKQTNIDNNYDNNDVADINNKINLIKNKQAIGKEEIRKTKSLDFNDSIPTNNYKTNHLFIDELNANNHPMNNQHDNVLIDIDDCDNPIYIKPNINKINNDIKEKNIKNDTINLDKLEPENYDDENFRVSKNNRRKFKI